MKKQMTRRAFLAGAAATLATPTTSQQITEGDNLNQSALGIIDYIASNPVVNETHARLANRGTRSTNNDVRTQSQYFVRFVNSVQSGQFRQLSSADKRQHLHCALDVLETNIYGLSLAKQAYNNTNHSLASIQRELASVQSFHANLQRNFPRRRQQCDYPRT